MVFSPIFLHLSVFLLFTIIKILRFYFHSIYICPTCISVDCYSANAFFCFFALIPYLILFLYHLVCFSLRLFSVYTTLFWPLNIFLQFYKNRALLHSLEKTKIFLISFPWILQLDVFFFFLLVFLRSCELYVAHQASPSMGFPRQEYWNGLLFPSPGDLPHPGIELMSPPLTGRFFTSELPEKPWILKLGVFINFSLFPFIFSDTMLFPLLCSIISKVSWLIFVSFLLFINDYIILWIALCYTILFEEWWFLFSSFRPDNKVNSCSTSHFPAGIF